MVRSTDITSVTDLRQGLRQHLDRVQATGRPLYITTNGETEAVLLSPKAYDNLLDQAERAELIAEIKRSEEDVKAGRTMDAREALRQIAKELGIKTTR